MNEDGDGEHGKKDDFAYKTNINPRASILELRRSTRVRNHVQRLRYDIFITQHFMVIVSNYVEPNCFKDTCEK